MSSVDSAWAAVSAGAAGGLGGAMGSVATMRVGVMYVGSVMPGGPGGRGRGGPGALVPVGRGATPGARQVLSLPPGTGVRGVLGRFGARLGQFGPLGRAGSAIGRAGSAIGQYGRSVPYVGAGLGAAVGAVGVGSALWQGWTAAWLPGALGASWAALVALQRALRSGRLSCPSSGPRLAGSLAITSGTGSARRGNRS